MGLRCLLGHDFTEPTTEREREERGGEVVTTITEVKECRRCGETQVVSETTEVTSLGDRSGPAAAGTDRPTDRSGADEGSGALGGASARAAEAAESAVDSADSADRPEHRVGDDAEDAGDGFDHPRGDPDDADPSVEDDAEIIRDGPDGGTPDGQPAADAGERPGPDPERSTTDERGHGEWPDAEPTHPTDAGGEERPGPAREWPDPDVRSTAGGGTTDPRDDEDAAASEARSGVASDAERPGADGSDPTASPADEDVEFIDADDDAGPGDWPEQDGEDQGFDAEVGDGRPDEDVTVDGNLTPRVNPNADVDEDAEFIEAASNGAPSRERRAANGNGSANAVNGSANSTVSGATTGARNGGGLGDAGATGPSTRTHEVELTTTAGDRALEYLCPECGTREQVGASSMRAGDICPECKRGYIEEREL